jgi:hypothetical protein
MAEEGKKGFEVPTTRIVEPLGGGRERRARLPILVVILIAIATPLIGWIGPRIEWRPEIDLSVLRPTPTPLPTPTPRPTPPATPPRATPQPAIEVAAGPQPAGPIAVDVDGLRLVDPTTGELGATTGLHLQSDAVFSSSSGDGWWCVCFVRASDGSAELATADIRRLDGRGRETERIRLRDYRSSASTPGQDIWIRFDLELSPDGRTGYLMSATRSGQRWTVDIDAIDLPSGAIVGHIDVGTLDVPVRPPPASPSPEQFETYLAGPFIRLSPDGDRLLVWAWVEAFSPNSSEPPPPPATRAWLTDASSSTAGVARLGKAAAIDGPLVSGMRQCGWVAWARNEEIVTVCWPQTESPEAPDAMLNVTRFGTDATEIGRAEIKGPIGSWVAEPILDRANGELFVWEPERHVLHRVDLGRDRADQIEIDPDSRPPGRVEHLGPSARPRPDWTTMTSDYTPYSASQVVAEPGNGRIFAIGLRQSGNRSSGYGFRTTGIWAFDTERFSVGDRWIPKAMYGSLGVTRDGRWLIATGVPGVDVQGNPADWRPSLTIHDITDGRAALTLGSVGTGADVLLPQR